MLKSSLIRASWEFSSKLVRHFFGHRTHPRRTSKVLLASSHFFFSKFTEQRCSSLLVTPNMNIKLKASGNVSIINPFHVLCYKTQDPLFVTGIFSGYCQDAGSASGSLGDGAHSITLSTGAGQPGQDAI